MSRLKLPSIPSSQITNETVWRSRRRWLQQAGLSAVALAGGALWHDGLRAEQVEGELASTLNPAYSLPDMPTSEKDISSYNNFYEFGTGKTDPLRHAANMQTRPWTLSIEGEVARPFTIDLDDLLKLAAIEERIYRLRCVEAWSMVIPWNGYALSHLLKRAEPTGNAKFVQFVTAAQPENMPGLHTRIIDWPYLEGLRMDEAMHPLTMLVLGVYGKLLPNQNGAPVRLVVPWKYGFKSGKSLVKIRVLDHMPVTSWTAVAPNEYGFYANVNPTVAHPRWSQATERRIGDGLFAPRVETRMFNGYAEQVASLYAGMDLARYY